MGRRGTEGRSGEQRAVEGTEGRRENIVSRPLLRLMVGEYWFRLSRLSMMVIGSFASYTKTKSVEFAV